MNVEELEAHLREVIARVRAGETVEIADGGRPVARLAPCDPVLDRLEEAFPGMRRATRPASDVLALRPVPLNRPVDAVELIREEREDREFLR